MRSLRASVLLWLVLAGPWPLAAQTLSVEGDGARDEFLYAWAHIADLGLEVSDSPKLRRYPLYPYLQTERMRLELARVPAESRERALEGRALNLVDRLKDQPAVRSLRRDLLEYFGARRAWPEFLALRTQWPEGELPEAGLRCYEWSAQAAHDSGAFREKVLAQWREAREIPKACESWYAWIDTPERLSPDEIEQRAQFTQRKGLSMPAAIAGLPAQRRAALDYWKDVEADPQRALRDLVGGKPAPVPSQEHAAGMVRAFDRLARQQAARARPLFERLLRLPGFSDAQRVQLRRAFALGLAYDRDPEAVAQFARLPAGALDDLSRDWRLRSALWNGNWRELSRWLDELPEAKAREARWQYWRGRLHERRGDTAAAAAHYTAAAKEREYYGFLAAERMGRRADLRHQPLPEDWPTLDLLAATPALRRAKELLACELPQLAAAEFNYALRDLPASAKPQAVRLAANWGWHHRAVRLQAELGLWNDLWLRFPLPFDGEVEAAARDARLPPNWLYTVIRTESLYDPRAVSRVGAQGLLQLMPATARAVAQRAGVRPPSGDDLFRPEINISLGAHYLKEMNDKFGGALILTLAAYNAGPQRIPKWLPERPVDGDIWVENIPFNETRDYVQRALSSLVMIGWRRTGEPAPILPLLAPVSPHPGSDR